MTLWIKVDVDFFDHPKTARAGVPAAFLFLKMVAYCKRVAPDGRVPKKADMGRIGSRANVAALVAAGFLHDDGDAWQVHDFGQWQTTNAELSAKRSVAGANGARKRWQSDSNADGKSDGNCHSAPMANTVANVDSKPIAETETETERDQLLLSADDSPTGKGPPLAAIRTVFAHWAKVMGKNAATKLDGKRKGAIRARLIDGFTVEDLCRAVDGCRADAFSMGANDRGKSFNDIELICRDAPHVERFMGLSTTAPTNGQSDLGALYAEAAASDAASASRRLRAVQ